MPTETVNIADVVILEKKYNKIKLIISDVDGTFTDGNIYYNKEGVEDIFISHTRDNKAVELCHENDIGFCFMTSTKERMSLLKRCLDLKIDYYYLFQNVKDKLKCFVNTLMNNQSECFCDVNIDEIAYIGDDINDIEIMQYIQKNGGLIACPDDAVWKVKFLHSIRIMNNNGGHGAVREFVDWIIKRNND